MTRNSRADERDHEHGRPRVFASSPDQFRHPKGKQVGCQAHEPGPAPVTSGPSPPSSIAGPASTHPRRDGHANDRIAKPLTWAAPSTARSGPAGQTGRPCRGARRPTETQGNVPASQSINTPEQDGSGQRRAGTRGDATRRRCWGSGAAAIVRSRAGRKSFEVARRGRRDLYSRKRG